MYAIQRVRTTLLKDARKGRGWAIASITARGGGADRKLAMDQVTMLPCLVALKRRAFSGAIFAGAHQSPFHNSLCLTTVFSPSFADTALIVFGSLGFFGGSGLLSLKISLFAFSLFCLAVGLLMLATVAQKSQTYRVNRTTKPMKATSFTSVGMSLFTIAGGLF